MSRRGWSALRTFAACAWLASAAPAAAQQHAQPELAQAKTYFNAGAAAYELGDYAAAIQAFDEAYRLMPLPAVAFSLAQAERRQYFVSRERVHLERAIELYRTYLRAVETGGRRSDATDALAQLEPLAALSATPPAAPAGTAGAPGDERTRLMISSAVAGASVSLDGAPPVPAPMIARVSPGMHRIVATAQGHFPTERDVEALAGELIPVELALREQPASLVVRSEPDADLLVDGAFIGRVGAGRRLSLAGGSHMLQLAENGHEVRRIDAALAPGSSRELAVELEQTGQRTAAVTLFVVGGGGLLGGAILSALALEREEAAGQIEQQRADGNITPRQLRDYDEAKRDRNRWRAIAAASFGASLASIATGMLLYLLDAPDLREPAPSSRAAELRVELPARGRAGAGVTGTIRF